MPDSEAFSHLVVVGSSAGGIDALSTFLAGLPTDFSAPIVIAQHLDPTRPSHLSDILGRRSALPVRTVTEHEPLASGVAYVVPANRHVHITDSHIELSTDGAARPIPSVDVLLSSAAEAFGDRLIAVILSGTGSDGAAGARLVKQSGGTVIIQDPDTATYPGMPLSLAPTTVDIIANVEKMGGILRDLLSGISVPTKPDEKKTLESFLEEIRERFGLDFNSYKTPTILRRLQRRIVATDTDDLDGYIDYVHTHPEEYQQLINAFLIKVTEFFRDPDLFAYLRETVVPDLITQSRKRGNELRIWSAGTATGEEAYSLAIVLSEALGNAMEHFSVRIFATDADADAIAFARRGIYPASALVHMPEDLIGRYFTKDDGNFQIKKRVRSLTVFGQHDLGGRAPFPHIDLVMCRNVLIYFTPDLQQRTLKLFAYSLRDGGYLVLGKAETPGPLADFFVPQHKTLKVYRRQGDRILIPPARPTSMVPAPSNQRMTLVRRMPGGVEAVHEQRDVQRMRGAESFLLRLPIGVVVVDRNYDIQTINGAARRLLSIHGPAIGEDLIHVAQGVPLARLREAVDGAFRSGIPVVLDEIAVDDVTNGEARYLQVSFHPQRPEGDDAQIEAVMVIVQDITAFAQARRSLEQQVQTSAAELELVRRSVNAQASDRDHVIARLVETNRQLMEANQELTSANEELRATNEEFLVNTEETQAAIEEVETLNEELQATNEELETLNEELQATIEELNTTNDDLNARSIELQELARVAELERARLAAILTSMSDAVLMVNGAGQPVLTNAAYERVFGGAATQFIAQDEDGRQLPQAEQPRQRAARGETFSMEFTLTRDDGTRRWFEANGQPITHSEGERGGVLVIRDITERSLHKLEDEFMALASHELRTPLTPLQASLQRLLKQYESRAANTDERRSVEMALRQSQRMARLVTDLVDVRRLQSGKFTLDRRRLRLDELLGQAVESARTLSQGQEIQTDFANTPLEVDGDPGRLEQVFLNLLVNAITYAPGTQRIEVRLRRAGKQAEVQVRDRGPGIPAAELPQLFSRFYQAGHADETNRQGLGLGLYISKEIVDAHGGSIGVESTEGKGTTFTVRLPLA
jgi:two-component system, chemotaxis family, CheB/CheR fusion protein